MSQRFYGKRHIFIMVVSFVLLVCSCAPLGKYKGQALVVTHSPNPTNINESENFPEPLYPYVWYYSTEVRNVSDRDLKVIWFEAYFEQGGHWYGANILNRTLRGDTFMRWYGYAIDKPANDEWITPGEIRICEVNWHGSGEPYGNKVKWAYIAVDRFGNDYYAESIIEAIPINGEKRTE